MTPRDDVWMNWDIYEEHLDEATFLWGQWERALHAPDEVLPEVVTKEERLLARVDALVLGDEYIAERLLEPALASKEPERLGCAAFALLRSGSARSSRAVLTTLGDATDPTPLAPIQRAIEVLETAALPDWIQPLLSHRQPPLQALALDALGAHGLTPRQDLKAYLLAGEPQVAAAALRLAACSGLRLERETLRRLLSAPQPDVRDAALLAGLLSGQRQAWTACREWVATRGPRLRLPLLLLAMGGDASDLSLLCGLLDVVSLRAEVLWALGFSGRLPGAEACLSLLEDKRVGHLAAEAFCAMTGLVLTGTLVAEPSPDSDEEELDASSWLEPAPPPADGLPFPNASAVRAWWAQARKRFDMSMRYLRGKPWTPTALLQALWTEPMRRRHVLSWEVNLRSHGALQLRTRGLVHHQLKVLESVRNAPPSLFSHPFAQGLAS